MCNLKGAGYDIPSVSLPKIRPKIVAFSSMLLSTKLDNWTLRETTEKRPRLCLSATQQVHRRAHFTVSCQSCVYTILQTNIERGREGRDVPKNMSRSVS